MAYIKLKKKCRAILPLKQEGSTYRFPELHTKTSPKFNRFKHLGLNKYDGFYHKNQSSKTDGQKHVVCVNSEYQSNINYRLHSAKTRNSNT
jgi:hypothetical protein